jgi:hypothetical protein
MKTVCFILALFLGGSAQTPDPNVARKIEAVQQRRDGIEFSVRQAKTKSSDIAALSSLETQYAATTKAFDEWRTCRFSAGRDPSFSKPFPPDLPSRLTAHHAPSGCPTRVVSV